ncbi:MAG: hypothetical protein IT271_05460 [Chitinophagales bacterium]|nr:hypothetical protein [Chitinophagales bacterium]
MNNDFLKMMTDQELKEIEERCNRATKGPWVSFVEGRNNESGDSFIMTGIQEGEDIWSESRGEDIYLRGATNDDQDFIAHARQDIPRLLKFVRQLKLHIENK